MAKKKASKKSSKKAPAKKTGRRKSARASGKSKEEASFPYRKQDEDALADGMQVMRARYRQGVKSTAKSIVEEIALENDGERPPRHMLEEAIQERLYEAADSGVTYFNDQYEIIFVSDNLDAVDDVGIDFSDAQTAITKIAYFAYLRDLQEAMDELDLDEFFPEDEDED